MVSCAGGRDGCRETFVKYYPWHTAEYATAFSAPDWLYSSGHGINVCMHWEVTASQLPRINTERFKNSNINRKGDNCKKSVRFS